MAGKTTVPEIGRGERNSQLAYPTRRPVTIVLGHHEHDVLLMYAAFRYGPYFSVSIITARAVRRYGRGSVPSMEQRAKERETIRKERRAQSVEQEKENDGFVAKATLQQSWGSRISGRRQRSAGVARDVGCNGDIYERTAKSNTRREKR